MSNAGLGNLIRRYALDAVSNHAHTRMGIVDGYDPTRYAAKVRIMPEDELTGWLPIATAWMGAGWGLFAPVRPGDQVVVQFQESDPQSGFITHRLYDTRNPPLSVQTGEFWLVHQSGSLLQFKNDGTVHLTSNTDLDVTVGGNLNATVTGNASVTSAVKIALAAPLVSINGV